MGQERAIPSIAKLFCPLTKRAQDARYFYNRLRSANGAELADSMHDSPRDKPRSMRSHGPARAKAPKHIPPHSAASPSSGLVILIPAETRCFFPHPRAASAGCAIFLQPPAERQGRGVGGRGACAVTARREPRLTNIFLHIPAISAKFAIFAIVLYPLIKITK